MSCCSNIIHCSSLSSFYNKLCLSGVRPPISSSQHLQNLNHFCRLLLKFNEFLNHLQNCMFCGGVVMMVGHGGGAGMEAAVGTWLFTTKPHTTLHRRVKAILLYFSGTMFNNNFVTFSRHVTKFSVLIDIVNVDKSHDLGYYRNNCGREL